MIKQSLEILSPYAEKLNELLVFQANTDLVSLAPVVKVQTNLFSTFFSPRTEVTLDVALFAKKVENWSEYLLTQWITSTKSINRDQLEKLKMVALKIHEEKKVGLIKRALNNLSINDDRINSALATLENRVSVILAPQQSKLLETNALNIEKHPQMAMDISHSPPDSDSYKYLHARSFSETDAAQPFNHHYDRRLTRHIDARILDIQTKKENKKALAVKMRTLFESLKTVRPLEYQRFLCLVKSPEDWHAYGRALTSEEANQFLGNLLNDMSLHHYIPRLMMCLRFDVLETVLHGCSDEQLKMINRLFIKSADCKEDWFIDRYKKKRQKFADIANVLASQIDSLDERFREIKPTQITMHDIKQMDQLVACIQLHKQGYEAFSTIIRGALSDHATIKLLTGTEKMPSDLAAEYQNHLNRMSQDPNIYSQARGCPYEIINGEIFGDADLDDTDDAGEIFGGWGLLSIDDYIDAGLVNDVPEFVRREWSADPSLGHKMARCFALKKLAKIHGDDPKLNGIYLWKHLRIYNKFMLKQYLASPEIKPHLRYHVLQREYVKGPAPKVEEID